MGIGHLDKITEKSIASCLMKKHHAVEANSV